jgi:hypothetical protein
MGPKNKKILIVMFEKVKRYPVSNVLLSEMLSKVFERKKKKKKNRGNVSLLKCYYKAISN